MKLSLVWIFTWLVQLACGAQFEWSGAISTTGTKPTGRYYHTSVVYGDYMFMFGGYGPVSGTDTYLNDLHKVNLNTNEWSGTVSTTGTAPTARQAPSSVIRGSDMFVFGGYDGSDNFNDVYKLNLNTDAWSGALSPTGTKPTARAAHT